MAHIFGNKDSILFTNIAHEILTHRFKTKKLRVRKIVVENQ